ncbi:protein of unknown function DUF5480 [Rahnella phage Sarma103]|nr:protein of unknown function DUF5480 [Rahnella phage Sarma103]
MKKDDRYPLQTYAVLAVCASFLILSSPWSETSKVIMLTLCSLGFSSVALLAALAWLDTCYITKRRAGLRPLQVLAMKEKEILGGLKKTERISDREFQDIWEELNERERALYRNQTH